VRTYAKARYDVITHHYKSTPSSSLATTMNNLVQLVHMDKKHTKKLNAKDITQELPILFAKC
jgi:hypothetical protein